MTTITLAPEELAEIEARANAATPGPWEQTDGNIWIDTREMVCCGRGYYGCCGDPDILGGQEIFAQSNPTDANFIAHARADIPALLASHKAQAAEIERLTRERDELRSLSPALYRSRAAAAEAKVAALEKAMEEIRDHSANQDMNHKDFRVAAYHAADAALGAKP